MERFRQPEIKPKDSSEAPRQTIRLKSGLVLRARKSRTTSVAAASENGYEKGKKKVQLTRAASAATKDAVREAKRKRMGAGGLARHIINIKRCALTSAQGVWL